MASIQEVSFDRVAEVVSDKKDRAGCALLIGAGASVTAGIPSASGIVAAIQRQFKHAYEAAPIKSYQECMARLDEAQRHRLIDGFVATSTLNWSHFAIAELMGTGYVTRLLTTNFDPLVARACFRRNLFPGVYDLATSDTFRPGLLPPLAVFHLHGQHNGFAQVHDAAQAEHALERLEPVIRHAGEKRPWIVVGYSGENDPVFKLLVAQDLTDGLYWVGYQDQDPPRHVRDFLERDTRASFVRGHTADSFLSALAKRVGCFPPPFAITPFHFLWNTLVQLVPRGTDPVFSPARLDAARLELEGLIERHEASTREAKKRGVEGAEQELAMALVAGSAVLTSRAKRGANDYDEELLKSARGKIDEADQILPNAGVRQTAEAALTEALTAQENARAPDNPVAWALETAGHVGKPVVDAAQFVAHTVIHNAGNTIGVALKMFGQ
jgi:NAD-dependent SIR2 family protein deacetylase